MKRLISLVAVGIAFQYALGGIAGCSSAEPQQKESAPVAKRSGTLTMNLEATSDSGKVYRLRNATFFVDPEIFFGGTPVTIESPISKSSSSLDGGVPDQGAGGAVSQFPDGGAVAQEGGSFGGFGQAGFFNESGGQFNGSGGFGTAGFGTGGSATFPGSITLSSEDDPNAPVIERFLAPGPYDIDLIDGWSVEQVDNLLGTSAFVPATLESANFQFIDIQSDQETFVKFDFLVDGSRVTFGPPGRLIVGIGIHETGGNGVCGNGVVDSGEDCDGGNLNGQTCASLTMGSQPFGSLFCNGECRFDTTFCSGGIIDGGTGGFGTGGFGGTGGGVGLPPADAGTDTASGGKAGSIP